MKLRIHYVSLIACSSALALLSCYSPPTSEERLQESIVLTRRDASADFSAYRTFFLRPEIRVLDERDLSVTDPIPGPEFLPNAAAAPLLDETTDNMLARGYDQAADQTSADLAVELVYVRYSQSAYYCAYWGDWYYWGYPGYGYYYPYACSASTWQSGSLVSYVVDLASAQGGGSAPALDAGAPPQILSGLWASGVYGVEIESASFIVGRAVSGIQQAFDQSPYLSASP